MEIRQLVVEDEVARQEEQERPSALMPEVSARMGDGQKGVGKL